MYLATSINLFMGPVSGAFDLLKPYNCVQIFWMRYKISYIRSSYWEYMIAHDFWQAYNQYS